MGGLAPAPKGLHSLAQGVRTLGHAPAEISTTSKRPHKPLPRVVEPRWGSRCLLDTTPRVRRPWAGLWDRFAFLRGRLAWPMPGSRMDCTAPGACASPSVSVPFIRGVTGGAQPGARGSIPALLVSEALPGWVGRHPRMPQNGEGWEGEPEGLCWEAARSFQLRACGRPTPSVSVPFIRGNDARRVDGHKGIFTRSGCATAQRRSRPGPDSRRGGVGACHRTPR